MPATFSGLLLFVVFVLPGYVWVRMAEVRDPRTDRSGLLEAAELLFVGLVSSSLAAALVLWVGDLTLEGLVRDSPEYLLSRLPVAAWSAFAMVVLSVGGTALVSWLRFALRPDVGRVRPGSNPWFDAFAGANKGRDVAVQVTTRSDKIYYGSLAGFTNDPDAKVPDIALAQSISSETGGGDAQPEPADRIIIPGTEILSVAVIYQPRDR